MTLPFQVYICDTETTGLDYLQHEIIELSMLHLNSDRQKTWCLRAEKPEVAEPDALRINGHRIDDISHKTADGRARYKAASEVLVEVENWMMEDMSPPEERILVGQNVSFDEQFLRALWLRLGSKETYPFGARPFLLDTRQIELMINLVEGKRDEYYNLGSLVKKYGIKNSKAHTAAADTLATKNLLQAQLGYIKERICRSD